MELNTNPTTLMRNLLRTLTIAFTASLGMAAMAQGYIVTVHGSITPCNPAAIGDSVLVQTLPGTEPQQTLVAYINSNCSFAVDAVVTSLTGGFWIAGSCGNGMMASDSGFYSLTPPQPGFVQLNLNCGGGPTDCLGVPGGTALPGTACTTFLGQPGTWSANCACVANTAQCNACFNVVQTGSDPNGSGGTPWSISTTNCSTGPAPITYSWTLPNGSISTEAAPTFIFNAPGVYGICLTIATAGCTSTQCDTLIVDSVGFISNGPAWYDCEGVMWGPNTPGTPCDDGDPATIGDTWTVGCYCEGQGSGTTDCLGVLNGNALPGTSCTVFGTGTAGTWSVDCVCVPDTGTTNCQACFTVGGGAPFTGIFYNCSIGSTPPFTLFWDFGDGTTMTGSQVSHVFPGAGTYSVCLTFTNANGATCMTCDTVVVDANGAINPPVSVPCDAGFWAIQAYDSTSGGVQPIPNEVWVWNLSSGGNGTYQFLWEFGDGSSSTDAFPTHTYNGPGPWLLCLTMTSGDPNTGGCTDTYCDSLAMDGNGILVGMITDGHAAAPGLRSGGFTLNVIQGIPAGVHEVPHFTDLKVWPNPVGDLLNISFGSPAAGMAPMEVMDPSGRVLLSGNVRVNAGSSVIHLPVEKLGQGLYMVRIGDGATSVTQRFLKVR